MTLFVLIPELQDGTGYALGASMDSVAITFHTCAPLAGGYFYVLTPSGTVLGQVDVPKSGCRSDKILNSYFTELGTYTAKIANYSNQTVLSAPFTLTGTTPPPSTQPQQLLVVQFSAIPSAISATGMEILKIISDFLNVITGGKVGIAYFEGSDKLIFPLLGGTVTGGASAAESIVANSPKLISLLKWFAGIIGATYLGAKVLDVAGTLLNTIQQTSIDATIDGFLNDPTLTNEQKGELIRKYLNLKSTSTEWGNIVLTLGLVAIGIYALTQLMGAKK